MCTLLPFLEESEGEENPSSVLLSMDEVRSIEQTWTKVRSVFCDKLLFAKGSADEKAEVNVLKHKSLFGDVRTLVDNGLGQVLVDCVFEDISQHLDTSVKPVLLKLGTKHFGADSTLTVAMTTPKSAELLSDTLSSLQQISAEFEKYESVVFQLSTLLFVLNTSNSGSATVRGKDYYENTGASKQRFETNAEENEQETDDIFAALSRRLTELLDFAIFSDSIVRDTVNRLFNAVYNAGFDHICHRQKLRRKIASCTESKTQGSDELKSEESESEWDSELTTDSTATESLSLASRQRVGDLFAQICAQLRGVQWTERMDAIWLDAMHKGMARELQLHCAAKREAAPTNRVILHRSGLLTAFLEWIDSEVVGFVNCVTTGRRYIAASDKLPRAKPMAMTSPKALKRRKLSRGTLSTADTLVWLSVGSGSKWRECLRLNALQMFGAMRTRELFEVVSEWPESRPAVDDLRQCLEQKCADWQSLQRSLKREIGSRVLQCGAETKSIVQFLILTVESLKVLDGTGVTFDVVSPPLKRYLASRKDCVACIVKALFEDSTKRKLKQALMDSCTQSQDIAAINRKLKLAADGRDVSDSSDESSSDGADDRQPLAESSWQPPQSRAATLTPSLWKRVDTLSLLVSVFGSDELFADGYLKQCAQRLFARKSDFFDITSEIELLLLVKARFGDALLHDGDVMLRDVSESKRLQCADEKSAAMFDALVVSERHWPLPEESRAFALPPAVERLRQQFCADFEKRKSDAMTLKFVPELGSVDLQLQFACGSVKVAVTPMRATVVMYLMHFAASNGPMATVSRRLALSETRLSELHWAEATTFWILHGVVVCQKPGDLLRLAQTESEERYAYDKLNSLLAADSAAAAHLTTAVSLMAMSSQPSAHCGDSDDSLKQGVREAICVVLSTFHSHPLDKVLVFLRQLKSTLPLTIQPLVVNRSVVEAQLQQLCETGAVLYADGLFKKVARSQ